jgi:hypothetical protein
MRLRLVTATVVLGVVAGCGTTRWTDTARTATEQLLISDAMDRAVSRLDFRALAGRNVYLDATPLGQATDHLYLESTLRQHMLASGCILKGKREEADYVVEARAGSVGTDKREIMFGVPAVSVPANVVVPVVPSSIPEIPLVKRTEQRAVTKIALFAYNTKTGRPVWQSGSVPVESTARDIWVLGAGPFQRGSIYGRTKLAGNNLEIPLVDQGEGSSEPRSDLAVADEAFFAEPKTEVAQQKEPGKPDAQIADQKGPPAKTGPTPDGKSLAEQKPPASPGPPVASADPKVIPAACATEPGRLPPDAPPATSPIPPTPPPATAPAQAANLVAPWPFEEQPDRVPLRLAAPANAAPMPVDRQYPPLGATGQTNAPPAMPRLPLIDPSTIFDP